MKIVFNIVCKINNHFWIRLHAKLNRQMSTLENLKFDNIALRKLPIDSVDRNYVRTVNGACFSRVTPTPVVQPKLVTHSRSAIALLGLKESEVDRKDFVEFFSGNRLLPGSQPAAHCYCGHQFGNFAGQLGDGAAIYLGEVLNSAGERWEIQLKGAGLTPYSRTADGRKVLRSSIREFLCSEAMHFLGVPTTRAGTCVTSDSKVVRDIFYDGHPQEENCSIVLRIAPTFIRFGSFEIFKTLDPESRRMGPSVGRTDILHALLDYVIETFYPEIHENSGGQVEKYAAFFKEVVLRTARLVAHWQCVGFCHGVLNTDNMSILGLTLDYGPFGFLDMYNPNHICNSSDDGGRYTFTKQPGICLWNLQKLAEALRPALPLNISTPLLSLYDEEFRSTYLTKMRTKLGLIASQFPDEDNVLIEELFDTMEQTGADFTNTFLCLSNLDTDSMAHSILETTQRIIDNCYPLEVFVSAHKPNVNEIQLLTFQALSERYPDLSAQFGRAGLYIQRILSQVEKAEALKNLSSEDKAEKDRELWSAWMDQYRQRIEKDLSAFDGDKKSYNAERLNVMKSNNPRFILRNYIVQEAIDLAEKGDCSAVQRLMELIEHPFDQSYSERLENKHPDNTNKEDDVHSSTHKVSIPFRCESLFDKPSESAFAIKVT